MLLSLDDVHTFYGTFESLKGVSLGVEEREIVTVLGANGGGKTTLLRTISGLIRPKKGSIFMNSVQLDKLTADAIVRLGLSHCPEGRLLFPQMPVYKNLILGAYVLRKEPRLAQELLEKVYELFPVLSSRRKQMAGLLSGGEQQMLAIGRALMSNPKLLMLDEPSVGLAPLVVQTIMDTVHSIRQRGTAVLLVEQNAAESLRIADRGYIMETGSIVLADESENLMRNEKVRQAYLGT